MSSRFALLIPVAFLSACVSTHPKSSIDRIDPGIAGAPRYVNAKDTLVREFQDAVGRVATYTGSCKISVNALASPRYGEATTDLECIGDPRYDTQIMEAVRSVNLVSTPNWRTIVSSPGWRGVLAWDKTIGRRSRVIIQADPMTMPRVDGAGGVYLSRSDYQALVAKSQIPLHAVAAADDLTLAQRINEAFAPFQSENAAQPGVTPPLALPPKQSHSTPALPTTGPITPLPAPTIPLSSIAPPSAPVLAPLISSRALPVPTTMSPDDYVLVYGLITQPITDAVVDRYTDTRVLYRQLSSSTGITTYLLMSYPSADPYAQRELLPKVKPAYRSELLRLVPYGRIADITSADQLTHL